MRARCRRSAPALPAKKNDARQDAAEIAAHRQKPIDFSSLFHSLEHLPWKKNVALNPLPCLPLLAICASAAIFRAL
jgi:hypothetical protein